MSGTCGGRTGLRSLTLQARHSSNSAGAFLPPILVLLSGGGLHVYWLMPTLMPSDVWRALAGRLDGATVALGLLTDRKCTTGVERMMRLVTTFNHKEQVPRRVMLSTGDRQVGLPVQSAVKHLCSGQPTHRSPALTVEQSFTTYPCILNWARPSAEEAVPFPPPSATQICDVQFMDDVAQSRPNTTLSLSTWALNWPVGR